MQTTLILLTFVAFSAFAQTKPNHREHQAHKHGAAKLEIAFQGTDGEVDIEAPSEGIYGFEYAPKSDADKKKQHDALSLIETNIVDMIQFDADLKCEISKIKIEVDQHEGENHSDLKASFKVLCQKAVIGSTVKFNVQKTFPKLKDVKVEFIADDVQKSLNANKNGSKIVLKK